MAMARPDVAQKPKAAATGYVKLAKDIFAGTCGGLQLYLPLSYTSGAFSAFALVI